MNPLERRRLIVELNESETGYTNEKFYGSPSPERLAELDAKVKAARARLREAMRRLPDEPQG